MSEKHEPLIFFKPGTCMSCGKQKDVTPYVKQGRTLCAGCALDAVGMREVVAVDFGVITPIPYRDKGGNIVRG